MSVPIRHNLLSNVTGRNENLNVGTFVWTLMYIYTYIHMYTLHMYVLYVCSYIFMYVGIVTTLHMYAVYWVDKYIDL